MSGDKEENRGEKVVRREVKRRVSVDQSDYMENFRQWMRDSDSARTKNKMVGGPA